MRVLLVQPAPFEDRRLGLENTVWLSEPVALTSVAAMVPEHEVHVLDMRLESPQALPETLARLRPDIVGTTAMTTDAYQAQAVLRLARQLVPEALTVIGGHHATMMPEFYRVPYVDVVVKGEGELTFRELVDRWASPRETGARRLQSLDGLVGAEVRGPDGGYVDGGKGAWLSLDDLPAPRRDLIEQYKGRYFFLAAQGLASIFTSRGCSFDCNFCAIWEFYDRKTRYLSAEIIVDRMEACEEKFIFFLDDNFMTNRRRLEELASELERRGVRKYWMSQGRADFVARHPELIERLAKVGLSGLLSGYETNDADALEGLNKRSTLEANRRAAQILRDNGIISMGIFMVRADFRAEDFEALYDYIEQLGVTFPLVTILTPLPGTQKFRELRDQLLTEDYRLYDLLHSVTPTHLPREEFYRRFVGWRRVYRSSRNAWLTPDIVRKRWRFMLALLPGAPRTIIQGYRYQRIQFDHRSYLRDEQGIIVDRPQSGGGGHDDVARPAAK